MEIYKISIECAFVVFPFIAFILTIPFLIYQYRKCGGIPFLKSTIFYTFVLYLICALFLVVLPLPGKEYVDNLKTPWFQLKPLNFIKDISGSITCYDKNIKCILSIFQKPAFYTVVFNILLTIPFGIYLRYYFKCTLYKATFISLMLSTFFEITQLSGLFGIYSRPYRLFDIDDLIINTLGGIIGYLITPIFSIFLPTREELEMLSYEKGKKVTLLRRGVAVVIDIFIVSIFVIIGKIFTYELFVSKYIKMIIILLYYLIIPIIFNNQTIGKKILNIKITNEKNNKINIMARYLISALLFIYVNDTIIFVNTLIKNQLIINIIRFLLYTNVILNILYYFIKRNNIFLYEKITNTKNVSTI